MNTLHEILLSIGLTALLGGIGWIISMFYGSFKQLSDTVTQALIKLDCTISKMDERYNGQNAMNEEQMKNNEGKHIEIKERVDRVEEKLDHHIVNHIQGKINKRGV